jgi:hypothetical protein
MTDRYDGPSLPPVDVVGAAAGAPASTTTPEPLAGLADGDDELARGRS